VRVLWTYGLTLVTPPASEPVEVSEAKAHSRVEITEDDTYLGNLITAARQLVERRTGLALVTQTWRMSMSHFPWAPSYSSHDDGAIRLPKSPLASVTSITYVDGAGVTQTMSASDYEVDTTVEPGLVQPVYDEVWPYARCQANSVRITFVAGYGSAVAVPEPLKLAIKFLVSHWYENREPALASGAVPKEIPFTVEALLTPYLDGRYP
jgi:uncharacterized phiE125 gp8 family phage protein